MKKLAAILAMCIVMTSALVSCGDSDDSSGSASKKASTTSASDEANTDETASDEEDDTTKASKNSSEKENSSDEDSSDEEDVTEGDATKASKELPTGGIIPSEEDTKPEASVDTSELKGGDVKGLWKMEEDDMNMVINFKEDNTIAADIDFSSYISFDGKKVKFGDDDFSQELKLDFDGTTAKVTASEQEYLVLERTSGETSADNMDGTYVVKGGAMASMLGGSNKDTIIKIKGKNTYLSSDAFGKYEVNGNKMLMTEEGDTSNNEVTFGVDGDTLTIVDEDGEVSILTRAD